MIKEDIENTNKAIQGNFINNGWITIWKTESNSTLLYSALIKKRNIKAALNNEDWEINPFELRPYVNGNKYVNIYDRIIQPLVFIRDNWGPYGSKLEISEDFRLYYNLMEEKSNNNEYKLFYVNWNGDKTEVVNVKKNEVKVLYKFVKDFIAAKKMCLITYFNFYFFYDLTLSGYGTAEKECSQKSVDYYYNISIKDISTDHISNNAKTYVLIRGKSIIRNETSFSEDPWFDVESEKYEEFLIGYDNDGNELKFTCDKEKLGNSFGANPYAPHYLTPVCFHKEVLQKYYENPQKYSVEDGIVRCHRLWNLPLDNNNPNYISVALGDLGKIHFKEQSYWKNFNFIPPDIKYSSTTAKRWFKGDFSEPEASDLLIKSRYLDFNSKWYEKMGWYLFKPLNEGDKYHFDSLHLLTCNDNQKDFESQLASLVLIFIDSINSKKLREIINTELDKDAKSIKCFEKYLEENQYDGNNIIQIMRNLQTYRSNCTSHRKSSDNNNELEKVKEFFGMNDNGYDVVIDNIYKKIILELEKLDKYFL